MSSSELRAKARESLTGNYWNAVLTAFVAAIFGSLLITSNVDINIDTEAIEYFGFNLPLTDYLENSHALSILLGAFTGLFASGISIVQLVLGGVVQMGYCKYLLKQHEHQPGGIKDLFSMFDYFGQGFLQMFLRNLFTFLWGLLFIIPGIVKSYSYAMTPFIMSDNPEMKANDAITASRAMMDGHKGNLFILDLTFIGWDLLNILTLGIGSLFLTPYKNAARAAFYKDISKNSEEAVDPPADDPTETTH